MIKSHFLKKIAPLLNPQIWLVINQKILNTLFKKDIKNLIHMLIAFLEIIFYKNHLRGQENIVIINILMQKKKFIIREHP